MPTRDHRCPVCSRDVLADVAAPGGPDAAVADTARDGGPPPLCADCACGATRSPCVDVCRLDRAMTRCTSCLRTMDEVVGWARLDAAGRATVYRALRERRRSQAAGADATDGAPTRPARPTWS